MFCHPSQDLLFAAYCKHMLLLLTFRETELGCIFWMHYEKNRLTTSSWKSHKQAKKKKSLEPL